MAFDEIQFPTGISYGSAGGPGYKTEVIAVDSGAEERTARWATPLRQYDVSYGVKSIADLNDLIKFFIARKGAQIGFRFKDVMDYRSSADGQSAPTFGDQEIAVGDGVAAQFQLLKKYTSGRTVTRNITKPVVGSVLVGLDGVLQGAGWSCDSTTGIVTFTTAPTADAIITAGFDFDVPVRFGDQADFLLSAKWDGPEDGSFSNAVPLVEIRDGLSVNDDYFMGGAFERTLYATTQIALAEGRVQVFNADMAHNVLLPDKANVQPGGPIFFFFNISAFTLTVKDGATTVGTLAAGAACELILGMDSGGLKTWYMI